MASIYRAIEIEAPPEAVWDALRDIGALHRRLAPGFVTDVSLEEGARVVTFGNGLVARELIVDVDDEARRLVWSVVGGRMTHHNASAQVFDAPGGGTRFVWITDVLPDAVGAVTDQMMTRGIAVIEQTLAAAAAADVAS